MPRTTPEAVAAIIEVDTEIDLAPFLESASSLIESVVAVAVDENDDPFYTDPELELIERWLAAHFYTVRDPRASAESAGVGASYQSRVDLGLNTSHYGQMAMRLDRAGGLAALEANTKNPDSDAIAGNTPKATMFWLGTDRS